MVAATATAERPAPIGGERWSLRHEALVKRGEHLLSNRMPLLSMWQDIAENFYPERADFTLTRSMGDDFAYNLSSSYPLLVARDLGSQIGQMLRPTGQDWFKTGVNRNDDQIDNAGHAWLEMASRVQRRAMYDKAARLSRATKETDRDYVTFGQGVMSAEINWNTTSLLHRSWHLRDVAWCDGPDGEINFWVRKWQPTCQDLLDTFGEKKMHPEVVRKVRENNGQDAYKTVNVRHFMIASANYDGPFAKKSRFKWTSVFIDIDNKWVIEERPSLTSYYITPRWETVTGWQYGTQYAASAAVVCALPDARLLQAMTYTLLKAGEKAVDPPMVAVEEAIRSDVAIYPGGITYVDAEYDERLGEVLRPLSVDKSGFNIGTNLIADLREMLKSAFYIDKLTLPPIGHDMTAYEVKQRVQEYIRQAMPLFEPVEQDYNQVLCSNDFELLMSAGAFGPVANIPDSLSGAQIQFNFENPLTEARDEQSTQAFMQVRQMIDLAAQLDPAMAEIENVELAFRDAVRPLAPSRWFRNEKDMDQVRQDKEDEKTAQQLATLASGAGEATQSLANGTAAAMQVEDMAQQ